jgi:hypothetical protein
MLERLQRKKKSKLQSQNYLLRLRNDLLGLRNDLLGLRNQVLGLRNQVLGLRNQVLGLRNQVLGLRNQVLNLAKARIKEGAKGHYPGDRINLPMAKTRRCNPGNVTIDIDFISDPLGQPCRHEDNHCGPL